MPATRHTTLTENRTTTSRPWQLEARHRHEPCLSDDQSWLLAGHQNYSQHRDRFQDTPDSMRRGGEEASHSGDLATAYFFYAKAVDLAYTAVLRPHDHLLQDDVRLVCLYEQALTKVIETHPQADILGSWNDENAVWTALAIIRLTRFYWTAGHPNELLAKVCNQVLALTGLTITDPP
jgi:hypothetical protein